MKLRSGLQDELNPTYKYASEHPKVSVESQNSAPSDSSVNILERFIKKMHREGLGIARGFEVFLRLAPKTGISALSRRMKAAPITLVIYGSITDVATVST